MGAKRGSYGDIKIAAVDLEKVRAAVEGKCPVSMICGTILPRPDFANWEVACLGRRISGRLGISNPLEIAFSLVLLYNLRIIIGHGDR